MDLKESREALEGERGKDKCCDEIVVLKIKEMRKIKDIIKEKKKVMVR